jgi:hypothetical protein
MIISGDDRAIVQWFCIHYPKCMALVPTRRRYSSFVSGVYDAASTCWKIKPKTAFGHRKGVAEMIGTVFDPNRAEELIACIKDARGIPAPLRRG